MSTQDIPINALTGEVVRTEEDRRNTSPDPKQAAHNLTMGMSIRNALMRAGYSEKTANKGMAGIPKKVLKLMGRGAKNMLALGKISAEDQEQLVRGRLVYNTIAGSDKGVNSAYRLGQDKRVNMFQPENQTGIVILNAPNSTPVTVESLPKDTE